MQYQLCRILGYDADYASEWDEQRSSIPFGAIDPVGGGSRLHISF
jgi:hypothetical protein